MAGWGPIVFPPAIVPIPVYVVGEPQVPNDTIAPDPTYSVYDEALAVPANTETTILTYTTPISPIQHLLFVNYGGDNVAKYYLYFDGVKQDQGVTYFSGDFKGVMNFETGQGAGLVIPAGSIVTVTVIHQRPEPGDFFAKLFRREIN